MIKEILETLSDGELMVIAQELADPNIDEQMVYLQITGKGNDGEMIDEMYDEMNSDSFRGTLPRLVAVELAKRYKQLIQSVL
jgi:hypothetical protein